MSKGSVGLIWGSARILITQTKFARLDWVARKYFPGGFFQNLRRDKAKVRQASLEVVSNGKTRLKFCHIFIL